MTGSVPVLDPLLVNTLDREGEVDGCPLGLRGWIPQGVPSHSRESEDGGVGGTVVGRKDVGERQ